MTRVAGIVVLWAIGVASLAFTLPLEFWAQDHNKRSPAASTVAEIQDDGDALDDKI